MNTSETINIEKYAHALNSLVGMDSGYLTGNKDVDAIVELIVIAKELENRVKELEQKLLEEQKMKLLDKPFTGCISRICVSDDPLEISRMLGFANDYLAMLAQSRMMQLKGKNDVL